MNVNNVSIEISAVRKEQYPNNTIPEIAFIGKSNVGKSSLLNIMVNRKKMARISCAPGKTRTINFFDVEGKLYFVDLPGYGYAKISKSEKEKWGDMIESYLQTRKQLVTILLLIDIRHDPGKNDIQMYEWLKHFGYNTIVVCTKSDKISKSQVYKNMAIIKKNLNLNSDDKIISFSSQTKQGKDELWQYIEEACSSFMDKNN